MVFSRGHATLHFVVLVGSLVGLSVRYTFPRLSLPRIRPCFFSQDSKNNIKPSKHLVVVGSPALQS